MKKSLIVLTVIALFAMCQNKSQSKGETLAAEPDTVQTTILVSGMTCDHCEMTIQNTANKLEGVVSIQANHVDSTVALRYDASIVSLSTVQNKINEIGYKVLE